MKFGKALICLTVLSVSSVAWSYPSYIDTSGREWLDLNQTRSHNWYDFASVCSAATGACEGSLERQDWGPDAGSVDLDGYVWATRDEVRDLFYEISGMPAGWLDSYYVMFPSELGYGANALSQMEFTIGFESLLILNGITRTIDYSPEKGITAYLGTATGPGFNPDINTSPNQFNLTSNIALTMQDVSIGGYFYRVLPISVPEPGSLALLACSAGILFAFRRRRILRSN